MAEDLQPKDDALPSQPAALEPGETEPATQPPSDHVYDVEEEAPKQSADDHTPDDHAHPHVHDDDDHAHPHVHDDDDHAHDDQAHDPLDPDHLIAHVQDAPYFDVPRVPGISPDGKLYIPQIAGEGFPLPTKQFTTGVAMIDEMIQPLDYKITKFMVLEVVGALIVAVVFIRLANRMKSGGPPKGRMWNLLEAMLLFIRDDVARPAIGKHDADKFLPFLWSVFFFILAGNLLGMVPWAGSPTGALAVTGTMALFTFATVIGAGMIKMGPVGFWVGQVPPMELPLVLAIPLKPMIFAIEVLGLCIKHFVLSVRLLANMMAGHLVLGVLIAFIAAAWQSWFIFGVMPASILGGTALGLLELFVAFLQAYIFTFLSALFIGMAIHPH